MVSLKADQTDGKSEYQMAASKAALTVVVMVGALVYQMAEQKVVLSAVSTVVSTAY
jgi:hypothetical protein